MKNISEADFIKIIDSAESQFRFQDDLNDFFAAHGCDGYIFFPTLLEEVVGLLENIFNDESHWIDYFCYELDFGKEWSAGMVKDVDGNDIPLKTAADLYKLIEKEKKEWTM